MSVILLDVDYFKLYNDHYGHQQGDQCLREISRIISGSVRGRQASAARYGGEEFAVVVSQADVADVERIAERLRSGIERLAIAHAGSPLQQVTASLGVATCRPAAGNSAEILVNAADSALYASKDKGRNRVTLVRAGADGAFEPWPAATTNAAG
jgi:diguanylate cyclase (GGDEF)-like protein